jgi:hypothetical protein
VEQTDPAVSLVWPVFPLLNDAASATIGAALEKDAKSAERWFVPRAKAACREPGPCYLLFSCTPTLANARLASVRCNQISEYGGIAGVETSARTFAIDGAVARALAPSDFFSKGAAPGGGFPAHARRALNALRAECHIGDDLDERAAVAAVRGFCVDADKMTLVVGPETACSAGGYEAGVTWDEAKDDLDPRGPITRVRLRGP